MEKLFFKTSHPEDKRIIELLEAKGFDDEAINASLAEYTDENKMIRHISFLHPETGKLNYSEGFSFPTYLEEEFHKRTQMVFADIRATVTGKDSIRLVGSYFRMLQAGLMHISEGIATLEWNARYPFIRKDILTLISTVEKLKKEYLGGSGATDIPKAVGINIQSVLEGAVKDNLEATVSQLIAELSDIGLLKNSDTNIRIMMNFFTGKQAKGQIDWLGTIYELHVFIDEIWALESYADEGLPKNKWQRTARFFTCKKKVFTASKITRPGQAPKSTRATQIISIIKGMMPASTSKKF